jgi:integrase
MPLTDTAIKNAKATDKTIKLSDGKGLHLEVLPNGSKLWRYRYKIDGKENTFAVGAYPTVSLADARRSREAARELVKKGIHPSHERRLRVTDQISDNENTFQFIAADWISATYEKKGWSDKYLSQIKRLLEADVYPLIGTLPIRSINSSNMLMILERIEKRGSHNVASLCRQLCSAIFCHAVARLKADFDPTYALRNTIKKPAVVNHPPLEPKDIPAFLKKLDAYPGYRTSIIAVNLLMLTSVRTTELRLAVWSEFDLENALWEIPETRMKKRRKHLVPLSSQAVALLRELHTISGDREFLFPNMRTMGTGMGVTTINRVIEKIGYSAGMFSAHGCRSTASTQLNEMGFDPDHIEMQLAHKEHNKTRGAYNHAKYLPQRKVMMQAWGDFLDSMRVGAKVIPLRRDAA